MSTAVTADGTGAAQSEVLLARPAKGIALVTLNRPARRNALTRQLLDRLLQVLADLRDEADRGDLRAVVLTGAGSAFCAGLDLDEVAASGPPDVRRWDVVSALTTLGVPVVAAVNGPAVTGGLEIALGCDFRIAGESARFADTHARVGVVPGWGLTARLPLAVGHGWARQMSATGDYVDARTAVRIGLANEVVPDSELLPRALAVASSIAEVDRQVLATVRDLYDQGAREGSAAALAGERAVWEDGGAAAGALPVAATREAVIARGRSQV
ncbi:enoyl-CoA hydratase [Streptomyces sp. NPDC021080]|uniref:enoyl-CoA hydratase n=1 Tax=Streptomyces sp. NPDC021080 TaxID=3365110 RepID=UPI003790DE49